LLRISENAAMRKAIAARFLLDFTMPLVADAGRFEELVFVTEVKSISPGDAHLDFFLEKSGKRNRLMAHP